MGGEVYGGFEGVVVDAWDAMGSGGGEAEAIGVALLLMMVVMQDAKRQMTDTDPTPNTT